MIDKKLKDRIDAMSREEMARLWRFAPAGDPLFKGEVGKYFERCFKKLGGSSPQISKSLG